MSFRPSAASGEIRIPRFRGTDPSTPLRSGRDDIRNLMTLGKRPPFLIGASDVTRLHFLPNGKKTAVLLRTAFLWFSSCPIPKKEKEGKRPPFLIGASDVTRTRDLLITSEIHYRLCYTSGLFKALVL